MPRRNKSIKHTLIVYRNDCSDKRKYVSKKDAIKAAEYQMIMKMNLELGVYKCETCNMWHLTRQVGERD